MDPSSIHCSNFTYKVLWSPEFQVDLISNGMNYCLPEISKEEVPKELHGMERGNHKSAEKREPTLQLRYWQSVAQKSYLVSPETATKTREGCSSPWAHVAPVLHGSGWLKKDQEPS
jgi:hypothetical protein